MNDQIYDTIEAVDQIKHLIEDDATDQHIRIWRNATDFNGDTFVPANIRNLMNEYYLVSGGGDKDQSERLSAYAADVKTFFNNLKEINNSYRTNVKNEAIARLRMQGYKFIGYDQL